MQQLDSSGRHDVHIDGIWRSNDIDLRDHDHVCPGWLCGSHYG